MSRNKSNGHFSGLGTFLLLETGLQSLSGNKSVVYLSKQYFFKSLLCFLHLSDECFEMWSAITKIKMNLKTVLAGTTFLNFDRLIKIKTLNQIERTRESMVLIIKSNTALMLACTLSTFFYSKFKVYINFGFAYLAHSKCFSNWVVHFILFPFFLHLFVVILTVKIIDFIATIKQDCFSFFPSNFLHSHSVTRQQPFFPSSDAFNQPLNWKATHPIFWSNWSVHNLKHILT